MHADHVLRALGEGRDLVHVQCGGVGSQNGARLHHTVKFLEDFFLDTHFLKHGFNHHVGIGQVVVAQRGAQQAHALFVFVLLELALFDLGLVVLANDGNPFVQGLLLHFQHLDGNTGVQEVHGNAATHGASADDSDGLDVALRRVLRHVWNFGSGALGHENVAQGAAFRREHQGSEDLALKGHAVVEFFLGCRFDGVHTLARCREVFRHALDHVARKLKVSIAIRVLTWQVAYQWQRPGVRHRVRIGQRLLGQRLRRGGHLVKQFLARDLGQQFALDRLAADNHVQSGFHAECARQALRATGTRNQPEFDFRQSHAAAWRRNAVMATECQLKPATHAHGMDRRHHRLGRVFDCQDDAEQIGFCQGFRGSKFLDVRTAREGFAATGQYNRFDSRVGNGFLQAVRDAQAGGVTQTVDGRIVHGDHRHTAVNFIFRCHVFSLGWGFAGGLRRCSRPVQIGWSSKNSTTVLFSL